ncbi:nucleotide exchange factor GrpE [Chloroflexota bacterium]
MIIQEEPEPVNGELTEEPPETDDPEVLNQALAEEKKKTQEYLASWQRTQADFINFKRRTEQERDDFSKFAKASLILSLLPLLDDLERAFNTIPPKAVKHGWLEGMQLIAQKFRATLEVQGISPINALRQDKGEEGIITEEFQKGYMLGDKVLRPSQVVVGNGEAAEEAKEEA